MNRIYNVVKSAKAIEERFAYAAKGIFNIFGEQLPASVDLRPMCSPVVDQGQLGSCTGNAIAAGLREFMLIKEAKVNPAAVTRLSRLFVYYEERLKEGTVNQDAGAEIADGMNVLLTMGVAPEADDPYDVNTFTQAPSSKAVQDAMQYRVSSVQALKNLDQVKQCLAEGFPVVFGMVVFESFEGPVTAQTGMVTMPVAGEQNLGGHCVMIVGYNDEAQHLIVRNSWGTEWGDHGYFYMPYEYAQQYAWDFWSAR